MLQRCPWVGTDEKMIKYHDEEWGVPIHDDTKLFEFLILEGAQAGLSWSTILNKREGYKLAYKNFDVKKIAAFSNQDFKSLLNNPNIVRNKLKITASINNAKCFIDVQKEFGSFSTYIWNFVSDKPILNNYSALSEIPTQTPLSEEISKNLKKRGFKFIGPTIIYSHMQATGMVNDHLISCFRHKEIS